MEDNRLEKILVLQGPPRSGKGTIREALTTCVGSDNIASTSLEQLSSDRFGLAPLVGKLLAILPDAHLTRKSDDRAAVEIRQVHLRR